MSKELTVREELPELPVQVRLHFKNISEEEELALRVLYSGQKQKPNFTEWLESYQQNNFFKHAMSTEMTMERFKKALKEKQSIKTEGMRESELKLHNKQIKQLADLVSRTGGEWLDLQKELRKLVQENLNREAPKKVEITERKTLGLEDIHKIMRENSIDVGGRE